MSAMLSKIAQRAARRMAGYRCGYTFKAQRTPKGTLDSAYASLDFFTHRLSEKTAAQQHRRAVTHTAAYLYHSTTKRPITEEFNLAVVITSRT